MKPRYFIFCLIAVLPFALFGKPPREIWERYTVAFIGQESNPAYGPAKQGARDAANILEHEYKLAITIRDLTPNARNGLNQSSALEEAFIEGVEAVIISVNDPQKLNQQLTMMAKQGVLLITFDGDAPKVPRLATVGSDEAALGSNAFKAAAGKLPRGGNLAVLAGLESNSVQQKRLAGLQAAAEADEKVAIQGVYRCQENFQDAISTLQQAARDDKEQEIDGWVFLGPWALEGSTPLPWAPNEKVCVSVDALPPMLPYLTQEQVDALIAQMYYRWGYLAMETAINAIHLKKVPEQRVIQTGSEIITKDNLAAYSEDWINWMP